MGKKKAEEVTEAQPDAIEWIDDYVAEREEQERDGDVSVSGFSAYLAGCEDDIGEQIAIPHYKGAWVRLAAPSYSAEIQRRLTKQWKAKHGKSKGYKLSPAESDAIALRSFFGRESSIRDWHLPEDDGPIPYSEEIYEQLIKKVPFKAFILTKMKMLEERMTDDQATSQGN